MGLGGGTKYIYIYIYMKDRVRDQTKNIIGIKKIYRGDQKNIMASKKNIPNVENINDFEGAATRYQGFG